MIKATITHIIPAARNGGDARAEARSSALVSESNPNGLVSFYIRPPFWTAGRAPYSNQKVMIGEIEEKMRPDWRAPRLLARDVSPAYAIEHYSPKRATEPTRFITGDKRGSWIVRALSFLGFSSATPAVRA